MPNNFGGPQDDPEYNPEANKGIRRKSKKKLKPKAKRVNWRAAAIALARCAVYALKFDKHLGRGSGVAVTLDKKTGRLKTLGPWQDMFFDALELIGIEYDRKKYYAAKAHKRRS